MSEARPGSAQKSSISWVSDAADGEPARLLRRMIKSKREPDGLIRAPTKVRSVELEQLG